MHSDHSKGGNWHFVEITASHQVVLARTHSFTAHIFSALAL